jgi:putative transposase
MARLARITPAGIPVHVIQRGNNRQECFVSDGDRSAYAGWLSEYSRKYGVEIHAWVLMDNHVHLLCTPRQDRAISAMMQDLGRRYVRTFNNIHKRSGTLWEGRYRSCLVQDELYLLAVYRYIELNPVRAGLVNDPGDYHWSSYQINGLGKHSDLCTPHTEYLALGETPSERRQHYRDLFVDQLETAIIHDIRENTNRNLAIGNDRFKDAMETLTGRTVRGGKRGRPTGTKPKPKMGSG